MVDRPVSETPAGISALTALLQWASKVYTDGTYSVVGPLIDRIRGTATKRAAAGIVAQYPDGSYAALRLDLTGQVTSAAGSELVAAVLAGKVGTTHTDQITDCKSLLDIDAKLKKGKPMQYHQRSLMSCRETGAVELRWHKSHPELRDEVWDDDDVGSWMADKAAEGPAGVARYGRVLSHEGNMDPTGVVRALQSASLTWIRYNGAPLLQPVKEVVTVETSKSYRRRRDGYRAAAVPPRPPKWEAANPSWAAGIWKATAGMSIRRRKFITNAIYDKHWHGGNLAHLDLPEVDTCCPLCGSNKDGQQHIIRECTHKKMVACRRQWDMHISRKVDAAAAANDPLARLYRGYYRIATDMFEDLPEAYQMWVGILTEDVMVALEAVTGGTEGAAGPDRQYTGLRQHCTLYTDATPALYRTRAELMRQSRKEVKGAVRAEKRGGKLAAPPAIPAGRDLRTLWPRQATGEAGYRRTVSEYDGPEEGRAAYRTQALEAAARRYVPTETLTTRKPLDENGALLHRWLGLGATQASAGTLPRSASRQRRKRPGKKGLITEFLTPARVTTSTSEVEATSPNASKVAYPILVDLSDSLLASQSALGPRREPQEGSSGAGGSVPGGGLQRGGAARGRQTGYYSCPPGRSWLRLVRQ